MQKKEKKMAGTEEIKQAITWTVVEVAEAAVLAVNEGRWQSINSKRNGVTEATRQTNEPPEAAGSKWNAKDNNVRT